MSNARVCRLCLEPILSDAFEVFDEMKSDMLKFLFLKLDKDISKDPIICSNCVENLQLSFDFRTSCLTNSNYFRSHAYADNPAVLNSVNINDANDNLGVICEEKIICRFCLNYFEKHLLKEINTAMEEDVFLRVMFGKCLPEIDINVERQLMCQNCQEFLQIQFNFIMTCLENEEKVRNFCSSETHKNLSDILNKIKNLKQPNISGDNVKLEPEDVNIEDYVSDNLLEVKKEEETETVEENDYQITGGVEDCMEKVQLGDHVEKPQESCTKRRRKPSGKRRLYREEDLEAALKLILDEEISVERAAKDFNIKKCTLLYHLNIIKKSESSKHLRTIFSDEEELALLKYLKVAARIHYGLTPLQLRTFAYEYAALNNKKIYSWMKEMCAGERWLRNFQAKYKNFPFLKPKARMLKRPMVFNRKTVSMIFEEYKTLMKRYEFQPDDIWSCAETAVATFYVPSLRGKKQSETRNCEYWGANITMISAVNASGQSIPPMLIFPRAHVKSSILNGAPPGTIADVNPSGWSNNYLFGKFINHFITHVKPSVEKPVVLLADNHEDHVIIPVIEAAQKSGILLITIPPYMSHKMQPLERGVFELFRECYNEKLRVWMTQPYNAEGLVNIYGLSALIGSVYANAFTSDNIIHGFRASGFVPFDENIFTDEDFMMADVMDRVATKKNKKLKIA